MTRASGSAHMTIKHVNHELIMTNSLQKYKITPCLFQRDICIALLHKIDMVSSAPTGSGKTITFFLPMLFETGITIIISPLNMLGVQHAQSAKDFGYSALAISQSTFSAEEHKVSNLNSYLAALGGSDSTLENHKWRLLCSDY